jgi:hypothetical protein
MRKACGKGQTAILQASTGYRTTSVMAPRRYRNVDSIKRGRNATGNKSKVL